MPTDLAAPFCVQSYAHADALTVEYVLDPATRSVRIQPSGDSCRVHCGDLEPEGGTISAGAMQAPLADGEISAPFRFAAVRQAARLRAPRSRARVEGRSIFVALDTGPGDVLIVSEA